MRRVQVGEGALMLKWTILLLPVLLLSACTSDHASILDRELAVYRYEQEKYRRKDLDEMYKAEVAKSDDLTRKILALRQKISRQEAEVTQLEGRLADLEKTAAEDRKKVQAASSKAAPPPAQKKK